MAGNKRWTKEEILYLMDNYPGGNLDEISEKLNRSLSAIHKKASDLGVSFSFEERTELMEMLLSIKKEISQLRREVRGSMTQIIWDQELDNLLKENIHMSDKQLSKLIGASVVAIRARRVVLGLPKQNSKNFGKYISIMKSKEKEIKEKLETGWTYSKIAQELFPDTGIKAFNISGFAYNYGFTKYKKKK